MNGTRSTSDAYTVLGNRSSPSGESRFELRVSLVILARGPSLLRPSALAAAHALGFSEILCVDSGRPHYDAADLVRRLPGLRFLSFTTAENPGACVNAAAREVTGDRFLVLWDDQRLAEAGLATRVQRAWQLNPDLAVVPELRDPSGREVPGVLVPGLDRDRLKILAFGADVETVDTLFPRDYTALYDRHRFLHTGGFDASLESPFWQKADWGLRSRLWGERLSVDRAFRVDYASDPPVEDQTADRSYPRFYLRNLAVRHHGDHGVLPWSRLWAHLRRAGLPLAESLVAFVRERAWVRTHRYRFQTDARLLAELWGSV